MGDKRRVHVGLEPDTIEKVDEQAEKRGVSRSAYIREATRKELQRGVFEA